MKVSKYESVSSKSHSLNASKTQRLEFKMCFKEKSHGHLAYTTKSREIYVHIWSEVRVLLCVQHKVHAQEKKLTKCVLCSEWF